jgi:hypothetical protein
MAQKKHDPRFTRGYELHSRWAKLPLGPDVPPGDTPPRNATNRYSIMCLGRSATVNMCPGRISLPVLQKTNAPAKL